MIVSPLRGCYFLLVASENWIAATDHDDFFLKVPGLLPTREWFAGRCFTVRSCGPILQAVHFNSF